MKRNAFVPILVITIVLISSMPILACAACFGNAQIFPEQYDEGLGNGIMLCGIAAIAMMASLGGANIAEVRLRDKKILDFSKITEPTSKDVRDSLRFVLAANEMSEISKDGDRVSIYAIYNGDGNFTDRESCYYDIVVKLSGIITTLFGNAAVNSIDVRIDVRGENNRLECGSSIEAKRHAFDDCYQDVRHYAIIDPYSAIFNNTESHYLNPIFSSKNKY